MNDKILYDSISTDIESYQKELDDLLRQKNGIDAKILEKETYLKWLCNQRDSLKIETKKLPQVNSDTDDPILELLKEKAPPSGLMAKEIWELLVDKFGVTQASSLREIEQKISSFVDERKIVQANPDRKRYRRYKLI